MLVEGTWLSLEILQRRNKFTTRKRSRWLLSVLLITRKVANTSTDFRTSSSMYAILKARFCTLGGVKLVHGLNSTDILAFGSAQPSSNAILAYNLIYKYRQKYRLTNYH